MSGPSGTPKGLPKGGGLPPCTACAHYFITHDKHFPYGCRLLGIKSRRQPQLDVLEASGMACEGYTRRSAR